MDGLVQVTDYTFDPEVLKCDIPVLAHFMTKWSPSCKELAEMLAEIATEYIQQLKVVEVDIDENPVVTTRYAVLKVPTLILFKNAQEVARLTGPVSRDEVLETARPFFND